MRWLRFVPALVWAVGIFLISSQARLPSPPISFEGIDKLLHAAAYAVGALAMLFGLQWPRGRTAWACALVAALYGISDEWHQSFVPGRSADVLDWLADAAGAVLCVGIWLRVGRRRQ